MNAQINAESFVLVRGAAGFFGCVFIELVHGSTDALLVFLDKLTYAGNRKTYRHAIEQAVLKRERNGLRRDLAAPEFVEGDICDRELLARLFERYRFTAIVNFAAESHVDRSIESAAEFIQTNVMGVFSLLDGALRYFQGLGEEAKSSFRFVQVSTDEVFGQLGETGAFSETTPYAPSSPYSASKAAGDHLARAWYHTYKLPVIVTNCSNNYGPRQYPEKLIPHMINCALKGKALPVYGNGMNVRDWIHVADHARGVLLALESGLPGESYCFGGRSERRNIRVVEAICDELDKQVPRAAGGSYRDLITFVEDRKGHDWRYAIDDAKAERELGFVREFKSFEEGLGATVKWYLENQTWVKDVMMGKRA
ncbi:MAG: dTDP-glucose 4,6-dehydratase [Bdellovibrionales bacterium]|jgi:dTDP-glucose 4,6-dehydratase|nr:dTDP-glucose 4,6-dehydratase [Bdellovibrionales bacterium]